MAAHPTHATTKLVAIVVRHIFSQVHRTRNATPRVVRVEKRISYLWASLPVNGAHATTHLRDNTLPRRSVAIMCSAQSHSSLVGKSCRQSRYRRYRTFNADSTYAQHYQHNRKISPKQTPHPHFYWAVLPACVGDSLLRSQGSHPLCERRRSLGTAERRANGLHRFVRPDRCCSSLSDMPRSPYSRGSGMFPFHAKTEVTTISSQS